MIKEHVGYVDVLSEEQCNSVVSRIDSLRNYWRNDYKYSIVNNVLDLPPLMVLGAASYRDIKNDPTEYYRLRVGENKILLKNFSDIYEILLEKLSNYIGDVELEHSLALPGFQIFGEKKHVDHSVKVNAKNDFSYLIHKDELYDQHYSYLLNKYNNVDKTKIMSITLSIKLPRRGSGLCVWEDDRLTKFNYSENFAKDIAEEKIYDNHELGIPTIINYYTGTAFCFSGDTFHQLAPPTIVYPGDRRITMQAFGMVCDDAWRLFF